MPTPKPPERLIIIKKSITSVMILIGSIHFRLGRIWMEMFGLDADHRIDEAVRQGFEGDCRHEVRKAIQEAKRKESKEALISKAYVPIINSACGFVQAFMDAMGTKHMTFRQKFAFAVLASITLLGLVAIITLGLVYGFDHFWDELIKLVFKVFIRIISILLFLFVFEFLATKVRNGQLLKCVHA